jgi:transcription initiation factor TFIID subunit 6
VLLVVLASLREGAKVPLTNGHGAGSVTGELRTRLEGKLGGFLAERVVELGDVQLVHAILAD